METTERKQISGGAKFFAVLLAILLALSLIVCLIDLTLSRTLFSANVIEGQLVEQKAYEKLPQVFSATILQSESTQANAATNLLAQLPQEQLNTWISSVLTEEYLQAQTTHIIDSLISFVNLRSYAVDLSIDLAPVKLNLAGQQSQNALAEIFNSLPECTQEQLDSLTTTFMNQGNLNGVTVSLCKPGEPLLSIIQGMISGAVTSFSQTLPDQYTPGGAQVQEQVNQFVLSQQYRTYYLLKKILDYSPWICLGLALLIVLFTLRSVKSLFSCLGVPLLIAGIVGLIGAGITYLSLFFLQSLPFMANLSGAMSSLLVPLLHGLILKISLSGALFAGGAFLGGLFLTILAGKMKN